MSIRYRLATVVASAILVAGTLVPATVVAQQACAPVTHRVVTRARVPERFDVVIETTAPNAILAFRLTRAEHVERVRITEPNGPYSTALRVRVDRRDDAPVDERSLIEYVVTDRCGEYAWTAIGLLPARKPKKPRPGRQEEPVRNTKPHERGSSPSSERPRNRVNDR